MRFGRVGGSRGAQRPDGKRAPRGLSRWEGTSEVRHGQPGRTDLLERLSGEERVCKLRRRIRQRKRHLETGPHVVHRVLNAFVSGC